MIASSAVLVSHAYPISLGATAIEPLETTLNIKLGTLAVLTFFTISGFFVSQSFDGRNTVTEFIIARALRLYPGLLLALVATVLIVGPIFTTKDIATYFSDYETILYVPCNLSLKWLQYGLPSVFHDNPYANSINGSLWSLIYEVVCYGLVVVVGTVGVTARRSRFGAFLCLYLAAHHYLVQRDLRDHVLIANFQQLAFPFVVGMAFYQYRQFVPMNAFLCAIGGICALLAYDTSWFREIFTLSWSYSVFYLGYLRIRTLGAYNRLGDYSYGMYIFAFPIEQIVAAVWKGVSPLSLIAVSFPIAVWCAFFSWHLVESRALSYRVTLGRWSTTRWATAKHSGRYFLRRPCAVRQDVRKSSMTL